MTATIETEPRLEREAGRGDAGGRQVPGPTAPGGKRPGAPQPGEERWHRHHLLARLLRWSVTGSFVVASAATAYSLNRVLPPMAGWGWVGRTAAIFAISSLVVLVLERAGRRVLPLAMLLELSVAFPDRVPARFSVALKAAKIRKLGRAVAAAAESNPGTPAEALTQALVLLGALGAHDRRTRGHSERVRAFTDLMGEELALPAVDRDRLRWAALLHDIGKLHVPQSALHRPGPPTDEDWEALRQHPVLGQRIVEPLRDWLGEWADCVGQHHERWDGRGYPYGLAGAEISIGGRIVTMVDAFEVMTSVRPYKRPVSAEAAREELVRCAGTHFDPAMVRAFLNISLGKLRRVVGPLAWLAQLPFIGGIPRFEAMATVAAHQALEGAASAAGAGAVAVTTAAALGPLGGPAVAVHTPPQQTGAHTNGVSTSSAGPASSGAASGTSTAGPTTAATHKGTPSSPGVTSTVEVPPQGRAGPASGGQAGALVGATTGQSTAVQHVPAAVEPIVSAATGVGATHASNGQGNRQGDPEHDAGPQAGGAGNAQGNGQGGVTSTQGSGVRHGASGNGQGNGQGGVASSGPSGISQATSGNALGNGQGWTTPSQGSPVSQATSGNAKGNAQGGPGGQPGRAGYAAQGKG